MPGRRKSNPLHLEPRVYGKHGAFYYVHPHGRWERLGTDIGKANERARLYSDTVGRYGTLAYWLDMFLIECEQRVKNGTLSPRTLDDYKTYAIPLKLFFAPPMLPTDIEPNHVDDYLAIGKANGRPVSANREKACLSSCMSWLIRTGKVDGLTVNPCLRASGIRRNRESKRDRFVTNDEYLAVYKASPPQVKALMELTYLTLQRPESDLIKLTTKDLVLKDEKKILRIEQCKVKGTSGRVVDIELTPTLGVLIETMLGKSPAKGRTLISTRKGAPYTYTGISSMLKRAIKKANIEREKNGLAKIPSFGFRDLKGKGATDMWLSGQPIERIQLLCGHEQKSTTEIYVKARWRESTAPNPIAILPTAAKQSDLSTTKGD